MRILLQTVITSFLVIFLIHVSKAAQFNIGNGDIAALKAAIVISNSNNSPDTIHLEMFGMYPFTNADNSALDGDNALPILRKDVSDANSLTIFGNGATLMRDPSIAVLRLLYLLDCKVFIYDINLIGGSTLQFDNKGGALYLNSGRLKIYNSLLKDNKAANGGAVYVASSDASFDAYNYTFTNNVATFGTGAAIANLYGPVSLENCTVVNNSCLNVNTPAAIYNSMPLNSNTYTNNVVIKNSIVAHNTYDNSTSPDNGKEFDLGGAVYTQGGNFIGSYPVVTQITLPTFRQGTPNATNDYVGTETNPIDPLLGALGAQGLFTKSYSLLSGSQALLNYAGTKGSSIPTVASNGIVPKFAYAGDVITLKGINLAGITKLQFTGSTTITTGITTTDSTIAIAVPASAQTGKILIMDPVPHFIFTIQNLIIKTITTPASPANLTGLVTGSSSVTLNWQDVADEDNYSIEYKISQDNIYLPLDTIDADIMTYLVQNLLCNTSYDFRIIALGRGTQSTPSNTVTLTTSLSLPATPGTIVGHAAQTTGSSNEGYSITGITGLVYHWSYTGTGVTLNQNGDQVNLDFSATATSGDISVTAQNSCGNSTSSTLSILVSAPNTTSIQEAHSKYISISPNPSSGNFKVDVFENTAPYQVTITNLNGQKIYQSAENGQAQIDLSYAEKGIYLMTIETEGKYLIHKIVLR